MVTHARAIGSVAGLGDPTIHYFHHHRDAKARMAQERVCRHFLDLLRGGGIASRQLNEVGDEGVPRIPGQQDNRPFSEGAAWNQIFTAYSVPGISFGTMLEPIVRVNYARDSRLAAASEIKGKLPAQ